MLPWLEEREASPLADEESVAVTFIHSPKVIQIHRVPDTRVPAVTHLSGDAGVYADWRVLAKNKQQLKKSLSLTIHSFARYLLLQ